MNTETILVSLIPNLLGGRGHVYSYHQAVGEAAHLLGWKHLAIVPPDPDIEIFPEHWHPCLDCENLELQTNPILKILNVIGIYRWGITVANSLLPIVKSEYPVILLLERFIPSHLVGLMVAINRIPTENLTIWLLYRRDIHRLKTRLIYTLFNYLIGRFLPPKRLHLLSDSELQAQSLSRYFKATVTAMPMPYLKFESPSLQPRTDAEIVCWWAGEPRREKGLAVIQYLATLVTDEAPLLRLIVAASAQINETPGGIRIHTISDTLTRQDYDSWLMTSDVILLPYMVDAYRERTSGVFVESILAGRLPIAAANTWAAYELAKHNLHELIVDWYQSDILRIVTQLARSNDVKDKINQMRKVYLTFHSPQAYAKAMQTLAKRTFEKTM